MVREQEPVLNVVRAPRPSHWAFALLAGPLAWFLQLNVGYALADHPCFAVDHRLTVPLPGLGWTRAGALVLTCLCSAVAVAALVMSWRALQRGPHVIAELGESERSRFLSLWGVAFSGGFALATIFSAVGIVMLPRCGG